MGVEQVQRIAHYKILKQIEKTPYWEIFAAEDLATQQPVFIHCVLPGLHGSDPFLTAFAEQAHRLTALDHPNLLKVLGNGIFEGTPYLITESFSSFPFSERIKQPHPVQWAAKHLLPIAQALAYLHQNNVVHGQVTAQSIRVNDNQIRLIQYGFYELIQQEIRRQTPQEMLALGIGELDYLSPEQIMGKGLTPHSDIYALGVLLFEAVVGARPYPAETKLLQVTRRLQTAPVWPEDIHRRVPSSAIRTIQKALARTPEDRFQSMEEFITALDKFSRGDKVKISLSAALRKEFPRRKSLRTALRILGAGAILSVLIISGVLAYQQIPAVQYFVDNKLATATLEPTPLPRATSTQKPAPSATATPAAPTPTIEIPQPTGQGIQLPVIQGQAVPANGSVLQPQNTGQVQEIARLGMGKFGQVAWNPVKSEVALATSSGVYIFNSKDLETPFFINTNAWADSVEFSRDGKLLAIGLHEGGVILWDVTSKNALITLDGHQKKVSDLVFSFDNRSLFSASYDRTVKMWDVSGGQEIKTIVAHSQPIRSIDVSRDGRFLVTGANDRLVKLWDIDSGRSLKQFPIPAEAWSVAISPDSKYIASGGADGIIRQWKIASLQLRNEPIVNANGVSSIQFSRQGEKLFYLTDRGNFIQVIIDGTSVRNRVFHFVDKPIGKMAEAIGVDFDYSTHAMVSPDGTLAAISSWDGSLIIIGTRYNTIVNSIAMAFDDLNQLAFSPNNQHLITGGELQWIKLWYLPGSRLVADFKGALPGGEIFSPDSNLIAYTTPDGNMALVHAKTGKLAAKMGEYPAGASVLFLRDGNMLAASTLDQTKVWDVPAKAELYQTSGRIAACRYVSARHNDEFLAIFTENTVFQNSSEAAKWICSMLERGGVNLATTSLNQSQLAFVNSSGLLELWDAESSQQLWRSATQHPISALAISPDGTLVASGSVDGSITLWETASGRPLSLLQGCCAKVKALKFSPNGKWLASASSDGILRLWGVVAR